MAKKKQIWMIGVSQRPPYQGQVVVTCNVTNMDSEIRLVTEGLNIRSGYRLGYTKDPNAIGLDAHEVKYYPNWEALP